MVIVNMIELSFPFRYRPDVIFIELPEYSAHLELLAFECPWGITDEILCYWDGILFGQTTRGDDVKFAKLLSTLDRLRHFPCPTADC